MDARMEIMAAIIALNNVDENSKITLYSDSLALVDAKNKKYIPKYNIDLFNTLSELERNKKVNYIYVKSHNDNKYNCLCDSLATLAMNNELINEKDFLDKVVICEEGLTISQKIFHIIEE